MKTRMIRIRRRKRRRGKVEDFTFVTGNEGWKFCGQCPLGLLLVKVGRSRGTVLAKEEVMAI
jgi:hypothetical protein